MPLRLANQIDRVVPIVLAVLFVVGIHVSAGAQEREFPRLPNTHKSSGFSISYPDGFAVEKKVLLDFVLYRFADENSEIVYLHIYSGMAPSFPWGKARVGVVDSVPLAGMETFSVRLVDEDRHERQVLVELPLPENLDEWDASYPNCLHIWYTGLAAEAAALAVQSTMQTASKMHWPRWRHIAKQMSTRSAPCVTSWWIMSI